jgi:hypothetical protein
MCLRLFAGVVTAITLLIPASSMVAGTNIHELLNSHPAVTSEAAPIQPFSGCGPHRHYDAKTRTCRGPGDF